MGRRQSDDDGHRSDGGNADGDEVLQGCGVVVAGSVGDAWGHGRAPGRGRSWSMSPRPAGSWIPPDDLEHVLAWLREARFGEGVRCPRCSCPRTHRWGTFSGRQRYRCTGCGRTFSDLTGTPAAYIKKLGLWPAYVRGMEEGESLRAAARRLGIHPGTAFRWRHRLLEGLRARDRAGPEREELTGWVELCLLGGYTESGKGCRSGLGRPARSRAVPWPWRELLDPRAVRVLVASDRQGHVVTGIVRRSVPREEDLERVLGGRLRGRSHGRGPVLVVARAATALHGYRAFARRLGGTVLSAWGPDRGHPLVGADRARRYWLRLQHWMVRFRGVATRYLPNYLVWHRWLDRARRHASGRAALRWPLGPPASVPAHGPGRP